jgi:hypothetical protein
MLMPALSGARRAAELARNLSQAHQWPIVVNMYGIDHDDLMPMPLPSYFDDTDPSSKVMYQFNCADWDADGRFEIHSAYDPAERWTYHMAYAPYYDGSIDPARRCRRTVFGTLSSYAGSPQMWIKQTDKAGWPDESEEPVPYHDFLGPYGGACCEEFKDGTALNPCWWGDDIADGKVHCEGFNIATAWGNNGWYTHNWGSLSKADLFRAMRFTIDMWKMNGYPAAQDRPADGHTGGPDGYLFFGIFGEVENGPRNALAFESGYFIDTATNVNGDAHQFRWRCFEDYNPWPWGLQRKGGWVECKEYEKCIHPNWPNCEPCK